MTSVTLWQSVQVSRVTQVGCSCFKRGAPVCRKVICEVHRCFHPSCAGVLPPLINICPRRIARTPLGFCIFSDGVDFHSGRTHLGKKRQTVWARGVEHQTIHAIRTLPRLIRVLTMIRGGGLDPNFSGSDQIRIRTHHTPVLGPSREVRSTFLLASFL